MLIGSSASGGGPVSSDHKPRATFSRASRRICRSSLLGVQFSQLVEALSWLMPTRIEFSRLAPNKTSCLGRSPKPFPNTSFPSYPVWIFLGGASRPQIVQVEFVKGRFGCVSSGEVHASLHWSSTTASRLSQLLHEGAQDEVQDPVQVVKLIVLCDLK